MGSRYDDELWELVPASRRPPPELHEWVAALEPARHALDLGCGDGALSSAVRADTLTLADVSPVALARAGARFPAAHPVELTPDEPLPFGDGAFDLVVCTETIEHVRDVQLLMSEVRRVLEPGGRLALTTPAHGRLISAPNPLSPHLRFFTRRSLRALLDQMGFEVRALHRRAGGLYALAAR